MEFGSICPVPIRDAWPGEATDFTPWLANHLEVLTDHLGMELQLKEVEAEAGDFAADIVALDVARNSLVVIENQYGSTDHRHLGQIITYASVLGAGAVVWVAETVRPDHKKAIDFLNQNLRESLRLFALEVSLIRIDDSKPAYQFQVVCGPGPAAPSNPKAMAEITETNERYRNFFQKLIDDLRVSHQFTKAKIAQPQSWYTFSSENSKYFKYSASFANGGRVRAEVYIDCADKARNEALFDILQKDQSAIEAEFGASLSWELLEKRRACRIASYRDGTIEDDTETLESIHVWMVQQLRNFKRVFPGRFEGAIKGLPAVN